MPPVRGRIEVNRELPPVPIPAFLLNEIWAHALESDPEECCGLVSGDDVRRFRRVHRCRNEMTALHERDPITWPRNGREAFHMNELDYLKVRDEAEGRGERVTAVYHSHVGPGAYFSEMDQEFAARSDFPFPSADHIVIAVFGGSVIGQGIFQRDGRTGSFRGSLLVAAAP
ncbi:MAG TPA: Mov34/MPN/PAD-1 family protein [Myxococcota bacterium]|nr:Mov34/MPN/PAD-1 family protein [Myxococcota bacterium]